MSAEKPADAPVKKPRKKLLILAAAGLVLAGGGGGGAWYFLGKNKAHDAAHPPVAEKKPAAKPIFKQLEVFTVNLKDPNGERYAQVGVTLQLKDSAAEKDLDERLPAVRNEILLLLSSKRIDELLSDDGKRQLAQQIRQRASQALGYVPAPVQVVAVPPGYAMVPVAATAGHAPAAADGHAPAAPVAVAALPVPVPAPVPVVAVPADSPVQDVLFSQFIVQ